MPDPAVKITELTLNRVAFVGAGDNPDAEVLLWKGADDATFWSGVLKRTFTKAQRIALAKSGAAIPVKNGEGEIVDGRYPIETVGDLKNAMRAIGRVAEGDRAAVVRHIQKRARALGATDQLGPAFKDDDVAKDVRLTPARMRTIEEAWERLGSLLGKPEKGEVMAEDQSTKQLPDDVSDEVREMFKALTDERDAATARAEEAEKAIADAEATVEKDGDDERTPIEKALADPDVPETVKAVLQAEHDRAEAAESTAKATAEAFEKAETERADEAAIAKVRGLKRLGLGAETVGPALRRFAKHEPEAAAEIERVLSAADAQMNEHMLELGKTAEDEPGSAETALDSLAEKIATEEGISKAAGYAKAIETPEGHRLMLEARGEGNEEREGVS